MIYPFGKDFAIKIFAWNDGERLLGLPAQTATLYVFDKRPQLSEAQAGTGAIKTSTLTYTSGDYLEFNVDAIDDPYPDAAGSIYGTPAVWDYWIAINFILSSSEQTQTIIRAIQLTRANITTGDWNCTTETLLNYAPQLDSYLTTEQLNAQIAVAINFTKEDLRNKGYKFEAVDRLDRFSQLIAFKAIEFSYLSQMQQSGDKFETLASVYSSVYKRALDSFTFEYAGNGSIVAAEVKPVGDVIITR